jgi:hypothetical protein
LENEQKEQPPVELYDAGAGIGPFDMSLKAFEELVAELESPATGGWTHDRLEELIQARGREVLRCLLQDHLDLRAAREESDLAARLLAGGHPAGRNRLERGHTRLLATVVGPVTVRRCALRAPGEPNFYPADTALSLPAGRHSHGVARAAVLEAVRSSYGTTKSAIDDRCGPVAGKRQLEGLVIAAAADIGDFYAAKIPVPASADTLLVLSVDAKGIVMRPEGLREATRAAAAAATGVFRTRLASGEKPNRKRMATLATVYDAEPAPRRPHDVITVPGGGRRGDRAPRPGPHATRKWLTGSVARTPAQVIAAAFDQAQARDPGHARPWIVLVDGAWHQIGLIRTEAARRHAEVNIVCDLIHTIEYTWRAAWCFHTASDPATEDWVATQILGLLAGRVDAVADAIETRADTTGLTGDKRRGADDAVRYLRGHADYLRYDHALQHGWPIATGVIEGAIRHTIGDRLEISGARWGLNGAEAVLTLRALIQNHDLPSYWAHHLAREHQRLHQHDYDLAA